jgi:hypothetical protein
MTEVTFQNRRAVRVENGVVRVTATVEGGHIAEIRHKGSGVNPLWLPPWPSIEPSAYDLAEHPGYGNDSDARLLAAILGHNICLDTFGGPSSEEAKAGIPPHGEGPVVPYQVSSIAETEMILSGALNLAQLRFTRRIKLSSGSAVVRLSETAENLSATDRPIAWTQHVTLGPPFLETGKTQFHMPATRSKVGDASFNDNRGPYVPDAEFDWPLCPRKSGGAEDFRTYTKGPVSGGFTTHLMDPSREQVFFMTWSPASKVLFGYIWNRQDFPWMARWEEHHLRNQPPWNGKAITCGMEFGVSPFVEPRRKMVERGTLFGVPSYKWVPAKSKLNVEYCAFITTNNAMPDSVRWDGAFGIEF